MTKNSRLFPVLVLIGLFTCLQCQAEVYKCKDDSGKLVFSDKKCSDNPEIVTIKKRNTTKRQPSGFFYCASGVTAIANSLLYPEMTDLDETIKKAESDLTNLRYRKMIRDVDPEGVMPDKVSKVRAEAFHASEVPGFSTGVVVNVKVCK